MNGNRYSVTIAAKIQIFFEKDTLYRKKSTMGTGRTDIPAYHRTVWYMLIDK